jgi:hypothetical protein
LLRLRPYKKCDAKHIVMWCKDEYAMINGEKWKIIELEITEADYQSRNYVAQN